MSIEGFRDIPLSDATTRAIASAVVLARKTLQAIPHGPQSESYTLGLNAARDQIKSAVSSLEHLLKRASKCN